MKKPIYFISDVHFYLIKSEQENKKLQKVSNLFDTIIVNQGTLIIVGDFFDFWLEHKESIPRHYFHILCKLSKMTQSGCEVHYVAGNHDFWLSDFITDELGIQIHLEPMKTIIDERKFYIAHGDGINPKDKGYHFLKKVLRNKFIKKLAPMISPALAYYIARRISHSSRKFDRKDPDFIAFEHSTMKNFYQEKFNEGFDYVILGHYHTPEFTKENGHIFMNCGDWLENFSFGILDNELKLEFWKE